MAMPRATAMDLCRHNRVFGVIVTMPGGVAHGHDPLLLVSVDTHLFAGSNPSGSILPVTVPRADVKTS